MRAPRLARHRVCGLDDLPPEVTAPLAGTLVRSLDATELARAFRLVVEVLLNVVGQQDVELARRLADPESLRADPELADLPVIMLTARSQDNDVAQGYNSGTDLYLTKPFNPAELLSFVQRILG